jgi:hypothetical protein
MGRVKRYKKLKACDPCAPKRGKGDDEDKYDLPPMDSDDEGECVLVSTMHARSIGRLDGLDGWGGGGQAWMIDATAHTTVPSNPSCSIPDHTFLDPLHIDPNARAGSSRKRRREEKRWARDALRDDEYVSMLEEKAKRRTKLPEVSELGM